MRNLFEYPITADEVNQTVERALEKYVKSKAIGGIEGAIWHALLGTLKDTKIMDQVVEAANPCLN